MFDLRSLACFAALAERRNFSRAAEAVHLSQPSLSQRISRLEDQLGFRLFDRRPTEAVLTAAGAEFLPHALTLLRRAEETAAQAAQIRDGRAGQLSIGYTAISFFGYIPALIQAFALENPDLRLELYEHISNAVEAELAEGRIDLGFLHPPLLGPPLDLMRLKNEPFVAVLPTSHPLATRDVIDFADLAGEPLVLTRRSIGPVIFDRLMAAIRARGATPNVVQEVGNSIAVIGLVAAGRGIGFVIAPMATLARPGVVYRPITGTEVPELPFALAHKDRGPHPARDRFLAFAQSYCQSL